jgi:hypothetical protein
MMQGRTMSGHRLLRSGGVACLLGVVVSSVVVLNRPHADITEEVFNRIQDGMTEEEVAAIIGAPAGHYASSDVVFSVDWYRQIGLNPECLKAWVGDDGAIMLEFDTQGHVCCKSYEPVRHNLPFWGRFRLRLGW